MIERGPVSRLSKKSTRKRSVGESSRVKVRRRRSVREGLQGEGP